jgi:hypothetical protein
VGESASPGDIVLPARISRTRHLSLSPSLP